MSKKTRLLVLTAGLIGIAGTVGVATGCSSVPAELGGPIGVGEDTVAPADPLTIAVNVDERIQVDVVKSAKAGDIVDVKLAYDTDLITIGSVNVNDGKAAQVDAFNYYFEMPAVAVTLTVDATIEGEFKLVNLNPDVELYNVPELGFDAGDVVSFSLGLPVESPYTLTDVEVGALNEDGTAIATPIEYTVAGNVYTFTAPADLAVNVGVMAKTEVKLFGVTKKIDNVTDQNIRYIYSTVGETRTDVTSSELAYYGSTIEVELTDTDSAIAKGVRIVETGEEFMLEEGETSVTFTMPAKNIHLQSIVDINYIPIEIQQGEHVTGVLKRVDEETGELVDIGEEGAVPNEYIYFDYTTDDENFKPYDVKISFKSAYGSNDNLTPTTDAEYGLPRFRMKNGSEFKLTFVESEKQTITLHNSTNLELSTYYSVDDEYVATSTAFQGEDVYVLVKDTSANKDTEMLSLEVTYVDAEGVTQSITASSAGYGGEDEHYYTFEMKDGTDYSITVYEMEPGKYTGKSFVGTYNYRGELYGSYTDRSTYNGSYTIDEDGLIDANIEEHILSITEIAGGGLLTLTNGQKAFYGEDFFVTGCYKNWTSNDVYIYYRGDAGQSISVRTVLALTDSDTVEEGIGFYQIYSTADGVETPLVNFIIDYGNRTAVVNDVKYVTADGTAYQDATTFTVTSGDVTIGTYSDGTYTVAE